jgi:muramoyltetrapeptide carboxypeptidase LdcA involved in peptidoglycan recycling
VLSGLPAGHIDDNHELPFGQHVTLDAASGTLYLRERSQA